MLTRAFRMAALATIAVALFAGPAHAEQPQQTVIYITDMHCETCAKKIAAHLYSVRGVRGVRAVVKRDAAYVTPEAARQPSPRALWEAIEKAKFKPVKLISPVGTFTQKPNI